MRRKLFAQCRGRRRTRKRTRRRRRRWRPLKIIEFLSTESCARTHARGRSTQAAAVPFTLYNRVDSPRGGGRPRNRIVWMSVVGRRNSVVSRPRPFDCGIETHEYQMQMVQRRAISAHWMRQRMTPRRLYNLEYSYINKNVGV